MHCFGHVRLDALAKILQFGVIQLSLGQGQGSRPYQSLIKEILLVRIRHAASIAQRTLEHVIGAPPAVHLCRPCPRNFRKHV